MRIGLGMIGQSVLLKNNNRRKEEEEGGGGRRDASKGNRIHILDDNKETRRAASQAGDERERESGIQGSISCHCSGLLDANSLHFPTPVLIGIGGSRQR